MSSFPLGPLLPQLNACFQKVNIRSTNEKYTPISLLDTSRGVSRGGQESVKPDRIPLAKSSRQRLSSLGYAVLKSQSRILSLAFSPWPLCNLTQRLSTALPTLESTGLGSCTLQLETHEWLWRFSTCHSIIETIRGNYILINDTGTSHLNELKAFFTFIKIFSSIYFYMDTRQYLEKFKNILHHYMKQHHLRHCPYLFYHILSRELHPVRRLFYH